MRPRTAIAASTLAFLTLLWTAPAAFAADDDDNGGSSSTTTAPAPQSANRNDRSNSGSDSGGSNSGGSNSGGSNSGGSNSGGSNSGGGGSGGGRNEPPTTTQPEPPPTPTRTPTTTVEPAPQNQPPQIAIPEPRASLSVSPKTVRPGDSVIANATCEQGNQVSLVGQGVAFNGNTARIDENTSNGGHTVILTCANGAKRVTATDSFTVTREPNGLPLKAQLAVSPGTVRPGDRIDSGAVCQSGRPRSLTADDVRFIGTGGTVDQNARDGDHTVTLVCENGTTTDTATGHFRVDRSGGPGGPGGSEGRATLKVSPRVVRQGDFIYANGGCDNGRQDALFGDDVTFRGDRGWVSDNAREGDHRVTRVCFIGPPPGPGPRPQYLKRVEVTGSFRVIRGDGPGNGPGPRKFWLSDRSGYRGDDVDVSVWCRDDRARLDSDVLDDITLHRDGPRLTGTTHVRGRAGEGWHRVTVSCDGNRQSTGFWLLRERGDHDRYLDLDPAFGHPGDSIDVHVGCDSRLDELDSDVLDDIDLDHDGRPWRYEGTTHVRDDAEPGEHTVRIRCGGDTLDVDFFVQDEGDHDGDNGDSAGGGNDVTVYPKGAPETGGGPVGNAAALGLMGLTGAIGSGATQSASTRSGSQSSARRRQR